MQRHSEKGRERVRNPFFTIAFSRMREYKFGKGKGGFARGQRGGKGGKKKKGKRGKARPSLFYFSKTFTVPGLCE